VIIDEEHRFGVRQKEALKRLAPRSTCSRSPRRRSRARSPCRSKHPRFLGHRHGAGEAAGDQDVRRGFLGRVDPRGDDARAEARGQIYFLHNEVESIERMRERLSGCCGSAHRGAHGQMPERELERVMRDFTAQRSNVLLCSTIIETGIDNPHANTIVINAPTSSAWRSSTSCAAASAARTTGYAYLLTPPEDALACRRRSAWKRSR